MPPAPAERWPAIFMDNKNTSRLIALRWLVHEPDKDPDA
jgi:hypothetical protein